MGETSFSARDLSQAADYFDKALRDRDVVLMATSFVPKKTK